MRKTLITVVTAVSITLAVWEVVAAPSRVALKGLYFSAPIATLHVAVPPGTKGFSTDLVPQ
jgi:hypothetical protein